MTTNPPYRKAMDQHLCEQPACHRDVPVYPYNYQYNELVQNWTNQLHFTAWQITRNKEAAEDIVQEAFLELWIQREKIIPENPAGWLIKVVSNLARNHTKRAGIRFRIYNRYSHEKANCCSEVEEKMIGKEKAAILHKLYNQLPSQQQMVLHLSREQGLRRQEIATILQLSPNTVKVHLLRAVQFMKEHIGCILLFALFSACSNIFLKESNTETPPVLLFNTQNTITELSGEKPVAHISK